MEKLNEQSVKQAYVGKSCNEQRYLELFNKSTTFYPSLCDMRVKRNFGITPALCLGWKQKGVDFRIITTIEDGSIFYCGIMKHKDNYAGVYTRNPCTELKPTQQELRLFERVMEYITTFSEDEEFS